MGEQPGADGGRHGDEQVFEGGVQANGHARTPTMDPDGARPENHVGFSLPLRAGEEAYRVRGSASPRRSGTRSPFRRFAARANATRGCRAGPHALSPCLIAVAVPAAAQGPVRSDPVAGMVAQNPPLKLTDEQKKLVAQRIKGQN